MSSFQIDDKYVKDFSSNGFAVIPDFLTPTEVSDLKSATVELIEKYCTNTQLSVFSGKDEDNLLTEYTRNEYFATSGDKIRGFLEESVVNEKFEPSADLTVSQGLNKIGHALHKFHPVFNSITFSQKIRAVVEKLTPSIKEPTVIQSMVIFKNPKVGSVVRPHQDATFLYLEPTEGSLLGIWIALDDATEENGCLHFFPGSHKTGKLHERFVRNSNPNSKQTFVFEGEKVPEIPKDKSVAAPAKSGDLVLIDGLVIHESAPNTSTKPRLAYTFHVIDGSKKYSEQNWNQPTDAQTFMKF